MKSYILPADPTDAAINAMYTAYTTTALIPDSARFAYYALIKTLEPLSNLPTDQPQNTYLISKTSLDPEMNTFCGECQNWDGKHDNNCSKR